MNNGPLHTNEARNAVVINWYDLTSCSSYWQPKAALRKGKIEIGTSF